MANEFTARQIEGIIVECNSLVGVMHSELGHSSNCGCTACIILCDMVPSVTKKTESNGLLYCDYWDMFFT